MEAWLVVVGWCNEGNERVRRRKGKVMQRTGAIGREEKR